MESATKRFQPFKDFSIRSLDILLENWRNYDHSESYIIPPIYPTTSNEIAGSRAIVRMESLLREQFLNSLQRLNRTSEFGQLAIFEALQSLILENYKSPFLAMCNLNMNHAKNQLLPLFPELGWDVKGRNFGEYDFILIGPKIGITVIEVKGSKFTQTRHFQAGNHFLPEEYKNGLSHLESTSSFLGFLKECTRIPWQENSFQKVLYTPNLEKKRFDTWMDTLDMDAKNRVLDNVGNVILWFKEDTDQLSMCTKVRQLLEVNHIGSICKSVYESYGAILAAFASLSITKGEAGKKIRLDEKKLLGIHLISNEIHDWIKPLEIDTPPLKRFRSGDDGNAGTSGKLSLDAMNNEFRYKFVGLSGHKFSSFQEQARFFLDTYSQNWCNYEDPVSYIIPPIFSYKNPDKSDRELIESMQEIKKRSNDIFNRPLIDRLSDNAEAIVYKAISQLVLEKIAAPFLAIQNLNLDKVKVWPHMVFPHLEPAHEYKELMREFDFVLIGPKVGIVVIEVKSSSFTQGKDFSPSNILLPKQIRKGIDQLNTFERLISLLQQGVGTKHIVPASISKVLFLANLQKHRFNSWLECLDRKSAQSVWKFTRGIKMWFEEDLANTGEDIGKPPLYNSLRNFVLQDNNRLPNTVFEMCGPILAGLASVVMNHRSDQSAVYLDVLKFEQNPAILQESRLIESQNPVIRNFSSMDKSEVNISQRF